MATSKPRATKATKADTIDGTLTIDKPSAGTDIASLSADERAELVLSFTQTRIKLQAMAKESVTLVKVDTPDNMAAAKAARAKLQAARITIEKTGKSARDETTKFNKAVIAKERELIDEISPEEQRLAELILAEQRRQEEAEQQAREEEQRRADAIRKAFERIRSLPMLAATLPVESINDLIAEATLLLNDQSHLPEDLRAAGRYEANVAINGLKAARDSREQADKDAAELAAFRAQQAKDAAALEAKLEAERAANTEPEKAAQEGTTEQRAQANAAEAQRAAGVMQSRGVSRVEQVHSPDHDDDDDLPPGHAPAPINLGARTGENVQVTVPRYLVREALQMLIMLGQRNHPTVVDLGRAIEQAERNG